VTPGQILALTGRGLSGGVGLATALSVIAAWYESFGDATKGYQTSQGRLLIAVGTVGVLLTLVEIVLVAMQRGRGVNPFGSVSQLLLGVAAVVITLAALAQYRPDEEPGLYLSLGLALGWGALSLLLVLGGFSRTSGSGVRFFGYQFGTCFQTGLVALVYAFALPLLAVVAAAIIVEAAYTQTGVSFIAITLATVVVFLFGLLIIRLVLEVAAALLRIRQRVDSWESSGGRATSSPASEGESSRPN
jgi:hypothetical protein